MASVIHHASRASFARGKHVAWLPMQVYYHNPSTGESSWQKPAGFEGDAGSAGAAPVPISSEQIPNTGWSEVTCSDGRKYYYHAAKEVHAFQPSEAINHRLPQIRLQMHIYLHTTECTDKKVSIISTPVLALLCGETN